MHRVFALGLLTFTFGCSAAPPVPPAAPAPEATTPAESAPAPTPSAALPTPTDDSPAARSGAGLDAADVRPVLAKSNSAVLGCHVLEHAGDEATGSVTANLRIAPAGDVERVAVATDGGLRPNVAECVRHALQKLRFPQASGPTVVKKSWKLGR